NEGADRRPREVSCLGGFGLNCLDQLNLNVDLNLITDQNATGFQRLVPGQTPLLAVDLGARFKPGAQVAPGVGDNPGVLHVEDDRLRHATDGQVAVQLGGQVAGAL